MFHPTGEMKIKTERHRSGRFLVNMDFKYFSGEHVERFGERKWDRFRWEQGFAIEQNIAIEPRSLTIHRTDRSELYSQPQPLAGRRGSQPLDNHVGARGKISPVRMDGNLEDPGLHKYICPYQQLFQK